MDKKITGNLFLPNWKNLDWSLVEIWWYSTIVPKRYYCPFEWFSKSSFVRRFPIYLEVLDVSQIAIAIAFCRIWPPSPVGLLFQRCHLSQIDEVGKKSVSDASETPHERSPVRLTGDGSPRRLNSTTAGRQFALLPPVTSVFAHTQVWDPRESACCWPALGTHLPGHPAAIKSPNFFVRGRASRVRLLQGALVILVWKQTSQFRSFGKWV